MQHHVLLASLPSSSHARQLQQPITGLEVSTLIGLGVRREGSVGSPQVKQRLHRLQLLRREHGHLHPSQHKVTEATVELLLKIQVVEGLHKVGPVEMGVHAEHLGEDGLADSRELLGKPTTLSNVLIKSVGGDGRRCELLVLRERDTSRVGGEDLLVVDLARDPALHKRHVLVGRQLNGLKTVVEPCVGVVTEESC